MTGAAAHWHAQVKLLGRLTHLDEHEETTLCSFLYQVTFIPGKLSGFCHGLGSAMAGARHCFIPLILLLKCRGLPGRQNLGSMRGQVF